MKILRIISLFAALTISARAFVGPIPFKEQVQVADAVARIVVVQIAKLEYSEKEELTFTGMAKCRIVTDYTGSFAGTEFVYIPCDYTFDESPSSLVVGRDYIICLEVMKRGRIAHPVSYDAAYEVSEDKLDDPVSDDTNAILSLKDFEARLRELLKNKVEQVAPSKR